MKKLLLIGLTILSLSACNDQNMDELFNDFIPEKWSNNTITYYFTENVSDEMIYKFYFVFDAIESNTDIVFIEADENENNIDNLRITKVDTLDYYYATMGKTDFSVIGYESSITQEIIFKFVCIAVGVYVDGVPTQEDYDKINAMYD